MKRNKYINQAKDNIEKNPVYGSSSSSEARQKESFLSSADWKYSF